ncbi:RES family NAD+ phosphorylase [Tahibacter sp.]|uniref:RES family NAD+ phosphorylase n=1 Tax=Tahibacter sp. TaxID=2056211 RepID=UPI0028C38242|nr:RES family NAD+ phosphorylase [Tahibacter sp.]
MTGSRLCPSCIPTPWPLNNDSEYWRVHSSEFPPGATDAVKSTTGNPKATGRFSLSCLNTSGSPPAAKMFYVAQSAGCALFETVLNTASFDGQRNVYVTPSALKNRLISRLKLAEPYSAIQLEEPARRMFAPINSPADLEWARLLRTDDYVETHKAASELHSALLADAKPLPGLSYPSRRVSSEIAYVLYEPPLEQHLWNHEQTWDLSARSTVADIDEFLQPLGFKMLADPTGGAYDPPLGAI